MTIVKLDRDNVFGQLDETISLLLQLIESTDEKFIHVIPFENSWTVAQLSSHLTKSIKGIAQALEMPGKPAARNVDERVDELRKTFLDFNSKFQSPEFVLPTKTIHSKNEVVKRLEEAITRLKEVRSKTDLIEIINLPIFGEITKFELLNFVLFHTQRHIHQLNAILNYLQAV